MMIPTTDTMANRICYCVDSP